MMGLLLFAALTLLFPDISDARGGHGRGSSSHSKGSSKSHHHSHPGYRSYRSGFFGLFAGTALAAPVYFVQPPVYTYPTPSFYDYPTEPPPAPAPMDRSLEGSQNVHRELVTVPGQWVDGQWVEAHDVWVPLTGGR